MFYRHVFNPPWIISYTIKMGVLSASEYIQMCIVTVDFMIYDNEV